MVKVFKVEFKRGFGFAVDGATKHLRFSWIQEHLSETIKDDQAIATLKEGETFESDTMQKHYKVTLL